MGRGSPTPGAAGLSAHLFEESQRPIGFILAHHADETIAYDGARVTGGGA